MRANGSALNRRAAALALCLVGMGALDRAIASVAAWISGPLPTKMGFQAYVEVSQQRQLVTDLLEPAGLVILVLVALRIAIPKGLTRRDSGLVLGILFALTAGRSFLGIGEGFSTDFGMVVVVCGFAALALNQMIAQVDRP